MLAAARASRTKRRRADSSPINWALITLQRHRTAQIDMDRFVRHSHRTATQLKRRSIFPGEDLVMVESQRRQRRSRGAIQLDGLIPLVESASECAHWTKVEAGGNSCTTSLASR